MPQEKGRTVITIPEMKSKIGNSGIVDAVAWWGGGVVGLWGGAGKRIRRVRKSV
jgi:hypothetical protein